MSASFPSAATDCSDPTAEAIRSHDAACELLSQWKLAENSTPQVRAVPNHDIRFENQLAVVRLGIASSLFYALRAKHPATAAQSLRVALSVSAWAHAMSLDEALRDRIEVAALLHDIGKIGIPDRILRKPGKLDHDERSIVDLTPQIAVEILRGCTADDELLNIIRHRYQWFDSRRNDDGPTESQIPLGSRMLAIAGAYDSMVTDTVYRAAYSRERAISELFNCSGSQFDPDLTGDFARMLENDPEQLQNAVAHRWLHGLRDHQDISFWGASAPDASANSWPSRFAESDELLDHWLEQADEGVIFTDTEGIILRYNEKMSWLTGIDAAVVIGQRFDATAFRMTMVNNESVSADSLIAETIQSSPQLWTMKIESPTRGDIPVEVRTSSIRTADCFNRGVLMMLRDLSDEVTLQEEIHTLQKKTVTDPLTKVSNRAHFDDTLETLLQLADRKKTTLSLVICDIDHFKKVNDNHGHQAGDEALVRFAQVLQQHAREGDLVARYGGEEFLLLAPSCDIATMTRRAEGIRSALSETPLPSLNNESVTASFGVTEYQRGDSAESIVARADRALLKAKDSGRNRVIQLGSGNTFESAGKKAKTGWFQWWNWGENEKQEFDIVTPVPVDLAIEKLRGFIVDHGANILLVNENQVTLQVKTKVSQSGRRRSDTHIALKVSLTLSERTSETGSRRSAVRTNVHILLEPIRNRDRRGQATQAAFQKTTDSLRSYLMGEVQERASR